MLFHDRALIDGAARITPGGHLVASARVARANNIQPYTAKELGLTDRAPSDIIRIFRPEAEVFARDAIASAAHRPITINHPSADVDAANWKQLAVGDTGGEVLRDGDFLRIPVMVMDQAGVSAATSTHQEFSLGYGADLDMTPGRFGDADYDGSMRNIRINHLALVPVARGGSELRVVDERPDHLRNPEQHPMKIKIGDAEVDATNGEAVRIAVDVLNGKMNDANTALATAHTQLGDANAKVATLETEKATLAKQLADATLTPEKLRDAAKSYALVVGKAKALGVAVTDAMDEPAIMAAVVTAKMGDTAKGWDAGQIAASFAVLAKDAKIDDAGRDVLRDALTGMPVSLGDERAEYEADRAKRRAAISDAWRQPAGEA
ncbi:MAG: DUF2213 domain-containing protein [Sphingomonas phyllosphaerae]|uniref:DUF2213 domain-containing protein n=1 Tax=Sphingomonas phyllosphaerae TaxID=257003 RepID=UPI002FF7D37E